MDFIVAVVLGVPSLFWETRMTLSGYYERQQAIQCGRSASSIKLAVGALLMILGIALVGIALAAIVLGGY